MRATLAFNGLSLRKMIKAKLLKTLVATFPNYLYCQVSYVNANLRKGIQLLKAFIEFIFIEFLLLLRWTTLLVNMKSVKN